MFNSDNPVIWFLGKIGQFILLNFLTILCCLPIFTVGASLTASYTCVRKMREPEGNILTKDFFRTFAANFKKSTGAWLLLLIGYFIALIDLYYAVGFSENVNQFFLFFSIILLFILISITFWIFPLISKYDNTVKGYFKNALLLAFGRLPRTIALFLLWGIPIGCMFLSNRWMVIFGFFIIVCAIAVLIGFSWLFMRGALMTEEEKEKKAEEKFERRHNGSRKEDIKAAFREARRARKMYHGKH